MKSRFQSTTRVQCPECRMELLPKDYSAAGNHVTCGHCGREIYLDPNRFEAKECPRCGKKGRVDSGAETGACCP